MLHDEDQVLSGEIENYEDDELSIIDLIQPLDSSPGKPIKPGMMSWQSKASIRRRAMGLLSIPFSSSDVDNIGIIPISEGLIIDNDIWDEDLGCISDNFPTSIEKNIKSNKVQGFKMNLKDRITKRAQLISKGQSMYGGGGSYRNKYVPYKGASDLPSNMEFDPKNIPYSRMYGPEEGVYESTDEAGSEVKPERSDEEKRRDLNKTKALRSKLSFETQTGADSGKMLKTIRAFQGKLQDLGLLATNPDGDWGPKSRAAWDKFLASPIGRDPEFRMAIKDSRSQDVIDIFIGSGDNENVISPSGGISVTKLDEKAPKISEKAPKISEDVPPPTTVKMPNNGQQVSLKEFVVATISRSESPDRKEYALFDFQDGRPDGVSGAGRYGTAVKSGSEWIMTSVTRPVQKMLLLKSKGELPKGSTPGARRDLARSRRRDRRMNRIRNRSRRASDISMSMESRASMNRRVSKLLK